MRGCCDVGDLDEVFGHARAEADARRYLGKGLTGTARRVADAVRARGVAGRTILEIGGGVGAIQIELLHSGAASATNVELSRGYEDMARSLLDRTGLSGRVERRLRNFVTVADAVAPADVVILDRVVCCYPDADSLVTAAATHAREILVIVVPVDRWWMRAGRALVNVWPRLRGWNWRFFVHPMRVIQLAAEREGLRLAERRGQLAFQMLVFTRA